MPISYARRFTGVLAGAGALLAALAAPAQAVALHRDGPISAGFPDIEVPVGGTAIDLLGPVLWSTVGPTKVTGVKVTYELGGVAGVRIKPSPEGGGECTQPSPARVICTDPRGLSFEGETVEQYLPVVVSATGNAKAGDSGIVTITFSADGLTPITGTSEVLVTGDRPNLPVTGPPAWLTGALGLLLVGAGALAVLAGRRPRARVAGTG
jgi:hypothetical protein